MNSYTGDSKVHDSSCFRRQSWNIPGIMSRLWKSIGHISETWDLSSLLFCSWFYVKLLVSWEISIFGNTRPSILKVLRTFLWCWSQLLQIQPSPNSYSSGKKKLTTYQRQLQCLGVFPGHSFMMKVMSQATLLGHTQKGLRNSPQRSTILQHGLTSCKQNLPAAVCTSRFKVLRQQVLFISTRWEGCFGLWNMWQLITFLSYTAQTARRQTVQDRMVLEALGESQRNSKDLERKL